MSSLESILPPEAILEPQGYLTDLMGRGVVGTADAVVMPSTVDEVAGTGKRLAFPVGGIRRRAPPGRFDRPAAVRRDDQVDPLFVEAFPELPPRRGAPVLVIEVDRRGCARAALLAADDFTDGDGRGADGLGHRVGGQAQRLHEVLAEHVTRVNGVESVFAFVHNILNGSPRFPRHRHRQLASESKRATAG